MQWNLGKVFHDDRLLYEFNLLPEGGHAFPAFINLQQPWFEKFLHDAILAAQAEGAPIELRGKNRGCGDPGGGSCGAGGDDARWPLQAGGGLADCL